MITGTESLKMHEDQYVTRIMSILLTALALGLVAGSVRAGNGGRFVGASCRGMSSVNSLGGGQMGSGIVYGWTAGALFGVSHSESIRDTDNDGSPDVLDPDNDSDGVPDNVEVTVYHTNINEPDSDQDGMPDGWEVTNELVPTDAGDGFEDSDGDGLSNLREFAEGSDPHVYVLKMKPGWNLLSIARAPVDFDCESIFGTDVASSAYGWDGDTYVSVENVVPVEGQWLFLSQSQAREIHLDQMLFPVDADSDGDGFSDSQEALHETDPGEYGIALLEGWNLVSLARVPEDNSVQSMFGETVSGEAWTWYDGSYVPTDQLLSLRGYWVHATVAGRVPIALP